MAAKYILKRAAGGSQYMFNLKAPNGETILTSETYAAKLGAQNGIESCRQHSPHDGNYKRFGSGSSCYFSLHANNNEIIGRSEGYVSAAGRDNGIESCKTHGPTAPTEDQT